MPGSLVKRKITVTFSIASSGLGPNGDADTVTLTGLRCSCQIQNAGMETGSIMALRIEGMTLDDMNRLSQVEYRPAIITRNTVTVQAGDDENGMSEIFSGGISGAFVDFSGAPNVAFQVQAIASLIPSNMTIDGTSFKGAVQADTIFQAIADKAGLDYRGYGIKDVLTDPAFNGSPAQQIDACARAIKARYIISLNTLMVWPKDFVPDTSNVQSISADNGLIGYPGYSAYGVTLDTIFNPKLTFYQPISIASQYLPAAWVNDNGQLPGYAPSNGIWVIYNISHQIQSETPDGLWMTTILAETMGGPNPIFNG